MASAFSEFLQQVATYGLERFGIFYGSYRGVVKANNDPENLGRVKVHVPQVHGENYPDVWAWPKAAWAGKQCGFFMIPDVDDTVYVSFDHGRPECPIWEGGWWGDNETTPDMKPKQIILVTPEGLRIQMDRENKRITLSSGEKQVVLDDDRIYLKHSTKVFVESGDTEFKGKVKVTGPLEVTGDTTLKSTLDVAADVTMHTDATIGPLGIKFTTHKHPTAGTGDPSVPIP